MYSIEIIGYLKEAKQIHNRLTEHLEDVGDLGLKLSNLLDQLHVENVVRGNYRAMEKKWKECRRRFDFSISAINSFQMFEYPYVKKYTEEIEKYKGQFDEILQSDSLDIEDHKSKTTFESVERLNHIGEEIHHQILYAMGEVDKSILDITGKLETQIKNLGGS